MSELRSLRSRVNALRRKMVHALAIVKVRRMAYDYCHRWFVATSNHELPPDPQRLFRVLLPWARRYSAPLFEQPAG